MPGGNGIDRFSKGFGNFGKGQLPPDPQNKCFALLFRKALQGSLDEAGVFLPVEC